jgi:hypothetical protein
MVPAEKIKPWRFCESPNCNSNTAAMHQHAYFSGSVSIIKREKLPVTDS